MRYASLIAKIKSLSFMDIYFIQKWGTGDSALPIEPLTAVSHPTPESRRLFRNPIEKEGK